ncbi:MAG: hypothetical protein PHR37_03925 [Eubacteriales bacterium]|nr:hypothetical protein [Eubacteriales bacterium]
MLGGYNLKIDLYSDWVEYLKIQLIHLGYDNCLVKNGDDYCFRYFNALLRLVDPVPRKVLIPTEFSCQEENIMALGIIKDKIERGLDITPYLSKNIRKPDYHDELLNDWGIHHLHLGHEREDSGFIERTRNLLFVRFDERHAYFLNVMPHGYWAKKELVEIIHKNWPYLIKRFKINNVQIEEDMSEEDVKKMRKAGANTLFITEDGTIYFPIGGGYATSGINMNVVRTCNYIKKRIELIQKDVLDNFDNIAREKILSKGVSLNKTVILNLKIEDNKMYVVEKDRKFAINYGDYLG